MWPLAFGYKNSLIFGIFDEFLSTKSVKMMNETFSVNFNHCDPRMEPSNKLRDILVNRQTKMQKAYRTLCTIKQSSFIISICSRRNQNVASCFYHHHRVLEAVNPGIEQRKFITWIQPRRTTVAHCSKAYIFRPKIQLYWIWLLTHFTLFEKTQNVALKFNDWIFLFTQNVTIAFWTKIRLLGQCA